VRLRLLKVDVDFTPPDDAVSLEVKHKVLKKLLSLIIGKRESQSQ